MLNNGQTLAVYPEKKKRSMLKHLYTKETELRIQNTVLLSHKCHKVCCIRQMANFNQHLTNIIMPALELFKILFSKKNNKKKQTQKT